MQIRCKTVLNVGLALFTPFLAAGFLDAQIIDQIDANIQHSFMIQKKTLPPGKYVFRIDQGSDGGVMVVSTADGKNLDQFAVRSQQHQRDQDTPNWFLIATETKSF